MKTNHLILTIVSIIFLSNNLFAGYKLIEKVDKNPDGIVIPYSKYKLDNGLTVIIHEDHSDPIIHVDVTYHVGSAREQATKSGFAHFFEHMMFQGSENIADEEHIKTVSEAGGSMNGTTNSDRTNYFETMPSNYLETALWLEADRMGFFIDAVTQKAFDVQQATVKNERGQNVDNRPYGRARESVSRALYPEGHPYSWPTIGWMEDIDRIELTDLKKFFLRWYGPNNATLTVGGDLDTEEVMKLAEKYFGSIPAGPEVKPIEQTPVTLAEDRYISFEDNIRFPLLQMVFPSVPNWHEDEAPLDVLSAILGGGKTSIFYKNFVKTQIAVQASVGNPCSELGGQFTLTVLPYPGKELAEIEKLMRSSVKEFETRGVTDDDILKFKSMIESNLVYGLQSVSGKVSSLASFETFRGDPNLVQKEIDRYLSVTKEQVQKVYEKYIKGKAAVILSVYPIGMEQIVARADTYIPKEASASDVDDSEYKNLVQKKAVDTFDRSIKPGKGANPAIKTPSYWEDELGNGIELIGSKSDEVPTVSIRIKFKAGHRYEPAAKSGMASITGSMWNESTEKYTAEQFSEELEKLGSSVWIGAGIESIELNISCLTKNLDRTIELAEELLLHSKFEVADFDRIKAEQLEMIERSATDASDMASNTYRKLLHKEGNVMSISSIGNLATVGSVVHEDVVAYRDAALIATQTQVVVVGDIDQKSVMLKLAFLKDLKKSKKPRTYVQEHKKHNKLKIYFVNKEGAPQSEIKMGKIGIPYDATGDYFKAYVMNYALGGAFNSRINLNLREDKGYTYGARSRMSGSKYKGTYTVSTSVRANATDSALTEILSEVGKYRSDGITKEELIFTKSSLGQSDALSYETPGQKGSFIYKIMEYDLSPKFIDEQNAILEKMEVSDIENSAKEILKTEEMVILIVGDKKTVFEGISKLGYEVIELEY
ncbi:MAG: insulinase family protein [Flavobacteriales bacterium]|nr:insulinase family protein [Flavobacteriales bacterium]